MLSTSIWILDAVGKGKLNLFSNDWWLSNFFWKLQNFEAIAICCIQKYFPRDITKLLSKLKLPVKLQITFTAWFAPTKFSVKVVHPSTKKNSDDFAFWIFSIQSIAEWLISHRKLATICGRPTKSLLVAWNRWPELQLLKRRKLRPISKMSQLSGRLPKLFQHRILAWSREWWVSIQLEDDSPLRRCLFTCFPRCSWKLYNQVKKSQNCSLNCIDVNTEMTMALRVSLDSWSYDET